MDEGVGKRDISVASVILKVHYLARSLALGITRFVENKAGGEDSWAAEERCPIAPNDGRA